MSSSAPSVTETTLSVVPEVEYAPGINWAGIAKRAVDLTVGTVLAVLALPLILVLSVGSAVTLRSWPLFVQRRVGRDGHTFPFLKLRTLPKTASPVANKYQLVDLPLPAFCRFLRRTHLDELPQLLLILPGWMSLVGPRPELPAILAHYPAEFAAARSSVRPGCTGLWQISRSSGQMIFEAPEFDLMYLRNGGFRLDAWIAYGTVKTFVSRSAYIELDDVPRWAMGVGFLRSVQLHGDAGVSAVTVNAGEA